jgi:hypothetical protein
MTFNRFARLFALLAATAVINGPKPLTDASACANCDSIKACNLDTYTGYEGCKVSADKCSITGDTCGPIIPD